MSDAAHRRAVELQDEIACRVLEYRHGDPLNDVEYVMREAPGAHIFAKALIERVRQAVEADQRDRERECEVLPDGTVALDFRAFFDAAQKSVGPVLCRTPLTGRSFPAGFADSVADGVRRTLLPYVRAGGERDAAQFTTAKTYPDLSTGTLRESRHWAADPAHLLDALAVLSRHLADGEVTRLEWTSAPKAAQPEAAGATAEPQSYTLTLRTVFGGSLTEDDLADKIATRIADQMRVVSVPDYEYGAARLGPGTPAEQRVFVQRDTTSWLWWGKDRGWVTTRTPRPPGGGVALQYVVTSNEEVVIGSTRMAPEEDLRSILVAVQL